MEVGLIGGDGGSLCSVTVMGSASNRDSRKDRTLIYIAIHFY